MNEKKTFKGEQVPFISLEYAEMAWNKLEMICPELDNNMRPRFNLRNFDECPMNLKGLCNNCTFFMGAAAKDGIFHASGVYDGYCNTKIKGDLCQVKKKLKSE